MTASIVDFELRGLLVLIRIISIWELTPFSFVSSKVILFSEGYDPLTNLSIPPFRDIATSTPDGFVWIILSIKSEYF
jgi:hypothetical protein